MPNLRIPLFGTRVLITLFMIPWTLMRFTQPDSARGVADTYYGPLGSLPDAMFLVIAMLMALLLLAFAIGFRKRISYGLMLLLHTVGTAMTIPSLIPGLEGYNQLFLAALPTIGAMWLLYVLRDQDTLLAVSRPKA